MNSKLWGLLVVWLSLGLLHDHGRVNATGSYQRISLGMYERSFVYISLLTDVRVALTCDVVVAVCCC